MIISPRFSDLEPILIFSSNYIAINLNEGLNLEADKADLNGPDISGRPGLGASRLQILHLRTAAVLHSSLLDQPIISAYQPATSLLNLPKHQQAIFAYHYNKV